MNWKHGYYADSGYTYGYYSETMPARLYWAALLQGHEVPCKGFRYLDAGCGQGLNLLLAAAAHPESEFVGIDFMPEHIAHARRLAEAGGITNVTFIEGDFVELARSPLAHPALAGQFDYAVCHGISTWISPLVKQALFSLIGQVLRPGGLFYNSYNTFPGWLGTSPLQHLVLLEQRSNTGQQALANVQQHLNALQSASPALFQAQPALSRRLEVIQTQDPAYLIQEYNNQYWQPVYFSQMHDELAAVKLSFLGSATLVDVFDNLLPQSVQPLLQQQKSTLLKEQLRDYAINQSFRRDLYVKGRAQLWSVRQKVLLDAQQFVVNPLAVRPAEGQPFIIAGSALRVNGEPEFYNRLLDEIASQPQGVSIGALLASGPGVLQRQVLIQGMSLLMHGGWILPVEPTESSKVSQRLNCAMADAALEGAPYAYLSLPRASSAVRISDTEWMLLQCCQQALPRENWIDHIEQLLIRLGRTLAQEGKPLAGEALKATLAATIQEFEERRQPFYQAMGAL